MLQKTKTTSKKFYNKWLYKVSLRIPGCAIFRISSLDDIRLFCSQPDSDEPAYTAYHRAWKNKEQILELAEFLIHYNPTLWAKRIESSSIDLYTNDLEFYSKLSEKFESAMIHRFEPLAGTNDSLDQPQTIVASKLPHNKYHYKVYLLPHKLAGDKETKIKFVDWIKSQRPRITCTSAVEQWFIKTDWNWDRRYVLVEDDHSLLMLKLRNSDVVGRVYKYLITDK